MQSFLNVIYLLSLSLWTGGMVYFSAFLAPMAFRHLAKEIAGEFVGVLFPTYYHIGYSLGGVMLIATVLETMIYREAHWFRMIAIVIMLGCSFYAGVKILPQTHQIKQELKTLAEQPSELAQTKQAAFRRLHRQAVILNGITLLLGISLIVCFAIHKNNP